MTANTAKGQQQQQGTPSQSALDKRYGKIGISAVAAAASVKQMGGQPVQRDRSIDTSDSD